LITKSITKLCVAGVLWCASSRAAAPDGAAVVNRRPPTATAAQIAALEDYSLVEVQRVYFSSGQSNPRHCGKATLDHIANAMAVTGAIIELRGYADGAASPAANRALSLERATAIAGLLTARGVTQERILILGLAEVDPAGPAHRAEHQRVDVRVFSPPTVETRVRHESVSESFIQNTWGGK
jgi:outer membrane protein OmpA-like peptidoglycan-associated protein